MLNPWEYTREEYVITYYRERHGERYTPGLRAFFHYLAEYRAKVVQGVPVPNAVGDVFPDRTYAHRKSGFYDHIAINNLLRHHARAVFAAFDADVITVPENFRAEYGR